MMSASSSQLLHSQHSPLPAPHRHQDRFDVSEHAMAGYAGEIVMVWFICQLPGDFILNVDYYLLVASSTLCSLSDC